MPFGWMQPSGSAGKLFNITLTSTHSGSDEVADAL